ncbi:MAG: hypothetical protein NT155_02320 [Candidatus Staskawiczbacteria bacterium]|nr:hypothetical protein [Candidatus Staskawiczbacteria bacterium]
MDTDKIFQSKFFRWIIPGVAGIIILIFVFSLGVFVGAKKADFSFQWADEYHRNFGGPQGGFFGEFLGTEKEFANSNGVFGQIIKVGSNDITVKGRDNVEKLILVSPQTPISYQRKSIKLSDLKIGDNVVVIGEPGDGGQIRAELIRVMPLPPPPAPNKK